MPDDIAVTEFSDDSSLASVRNLQNHEQTKASSISAHAEPANLQQKVTELRAKVFRSRLKLKEKRSELREERALANEIDAKFMSLLRQRWAKGALVEESTLERAYEELEERRNIIGTLEYEYDQAEYDYEEAEALLDTEEEQYLNSVLQGIVAEGPEPGDLQSPFRQLTELSSNSTTSKRSDLPQSLYERYQDRLGDRRIMKERLDDLRRQHTVEIKNIGRHRDMGRIVDESLLQSLNELEQDCLESAAQLAIIESDLENMQVTLKEANIPIIESPVSVFKLLEVAPTPSIRSDLGPRTHHSDSVLSYLRENFSGVRARINSWILETLKISQIEHAHHKTILRAMQDVYFDDRAWSQAVLEYWGDEIDGALTPTGEEGLRSQHRSSFVLRSSSDLASKAVEDFDLKFSANKSQPNERKESSWIVHRFQARPYELDFLGFDRLVHESRSV